MLFGVGLPVSVFLFEIFLPLIFKYFSLAVFRDRVGFRQILHKRFFEKKFVSSVRPIKVVIAR